MIKHSDFLAKFFFPPSKSRLTLKWFSHFPLHTSPSVLPQSQQAFLNIYFAPALFSIHCVSLLIPRFITTWSYREFLHPLFSISSKSFIIRLQPLFAGRLSLVFRLCLLSSSPVSVRLLVWLFSYMCLCACAAGVSVLFLCLSCQLFDRQQPSLFHFRCN